MITLDQAKFEEMFEHAPKTPDGSPRAAVTGSPCCQGAPVYLIYAEGTGKAGIRCCMCGQVNAEVLIAKSLIAHAPASMLSIVGKKPNGGG